MKQWSYKWTVIIEDNPSIQLIFHTKPTPRRLTSTKKDQLCDHHPYYFERHKCMVPPCCGKYIAQMKDDPSFINFWNQFTVSFSIHNHILQTRYWLFLHQILVLGCSELLLLPFFLVSHISSITGFLYCLHSFVDIYLLLSVLGKSDFF